MATVTLNPTPVRPFSSLQATIGIARIVQEFRRRLKTRVQRHNRADKPIDARYRRTFKSQAHSELHDAFKRHSHPNVCLDWPRRSDYLDHQDLWFRELLEELDKHTKPVKNPLSKTAANEYLFLRHDLRFDAKAIGLCELARSFDIVTAVLGRLSHRPRYADLKGPITSGKEIAVGDINDEKFIANLEHLLRRLQHILFDLLVQKSIELLNIEALYWQQHLNDGIFAEGPVLWGVCWMFYDSYRGLSKVAQNILLSEHFWDLWPTDGPIANRVISGAQAFNVAAQSPVGQAPSSSLQAPRTGPRISEPPPGFTAPQQPRQQGDESILSFDGQRQYGHRNSSPFGLYNNAYLPQNVSCSKIETAATSTWPATSGSNFSDQNNELGLDAWQPQYNQLYQQPLPRREAAPLLTLQAPDAEFSRVAPGIYSPQVPWDPQQNIFPNVNETEYDFSMPDSDTYPSPDSEASGQRLHSRKPSLDGTVMTTTSNPDQNSPSSVGTVGRPRLSLKRDQEPPRNGGGQITCSHLDCSRNRPPTFLRKCEWSKHMDKHDRPYICTEHGCEKIRGFTYSGGLSRHQREVHKKHGGPKAALMCPHRDCKRSTGVGFTRRENLVEHCRRVHRNDAPEQATVHEHRGGGDDDDGDGGSPTTTVRKRKRSLTGSDTEKYSHTAILDEGGDDLRDEVKRLKRENEEKDRRLRDLEAFVATLKPQMHRQSS